MSKFLCKCENIIKVSRSIPNPIEWLFISDVEFDAFENVVDAEKVYSKMKSFLKCDKCGRLWLFWNGYDNPPTLYSPEDY